MQHLVDMRANTSRAYSPKLQRMVQWLVYNDTHFGENAAHEGDTLISDNKFVTILKWLQSGEDLQLDAGDGVILLVLQLGGAIW